MTDPDKQIIQNIPLLVQSVLIVSVSTAETADAQKIIDSVAQALLEAFSKIKFIARVESMGVQEVQPKMASGRDQ